MRVPAALRRGTEWRKHHRLEEIVGKLRQVEVLTAQGKPAIETVWAIGVTKATYYRRRAEYRGPNYELD